MGTKLKKLTSICLAFIMIFSVLTVAPFTAVAAETDSDSVGDIYYTSGDFEYDAFYDETATIIRYNGDAAELEIPSTLDGFTVTAIGYGAFENCTSLKKVTVPGSITDICEYTLGYIFDEDECEYNKIDGFTICGYTNSNAEVYAYENGFTFVSIGEVSPFLYDFIGEETISITDYNGSETNLTIPSTLDGYTVADIGWCAFENCTSLVSVTIPDSVTEIGGYAFAGCTSLKSVTIPESVTYIGDYAFENCTSLESITIPGSVSYIGEYALGYIFGESDDCSMMVGFTIYGYTNSAAEAYAKDNGFDFISLGEVSPLSYEVYDDTTVIITAYYGSETDLTIPSTIDGYTVTAISVNAFEGCTNLESVTIPDSVTYIGDGAFENCTSLASVTIPYRVEYIGEYAFGYSYDEENWDYTKTDDFKIYGYTNSAAEVYAKDNGFDFVSIGEGSPFWYDVLDDGTAEITNYFGSETALTIPSMLDGYTVTSIGWAAFAECTDITSVTIPDSVTYIDGAAFAGCTSLESVTIPDSVVYIGGGAFEDTAWYNKQAGGVVYAGKIAYAYKGRMPKNTSITLDDGTKGIAASAFYGCQNLAGITIPDSVTIIGYSAFWGCTNLKSITIPDSVTELEWSAFAQCTSLESVTISDSVTYIGDYTFYGCTSLKSVTIPYSVTNIDENAFGYTFDEDAEEEIKIEGFTIYGYTGSRAEKYASENGFTFISIGDAPTPKPGDVNGDGSVSIDDVTDIQKYLANMVDFDDEQETLADVDKDKRVTIDDVTLIQKYLAGMAEI